MLDYRLYFMDRFSGHIDHRRDFSADSDAAAIETAEGWRSHQPMELWRGARKLRHWDDERPSPPIGSPAVTAHGE